ncbi:hypothetical protein BH23CHL2_BH23CHL2_07700 [soil metagenome]
MINRNRLDREGIRGMTWGMTADQTTRRGVYLHGMAEIGNRLETKVLNIPGQTSPAGDGKCLSR